MKKWLTRAGWFLVVVALVAALVVSLQPGAVPADVGEVTRGHLQITVDEDGPTRVKDRYVVSAPLTGSLARTELRPGDDVVASQVVARIAPLAPPLLDARSRSQVEARIGAAKALERQAHASIERARIADEFAQTEVDRQRKLFAEGVGTQQALDAAEVAAKSRAAELASARFAARVADHEVEVAMAALTRMEEGQHAVDEVEVRSPVAGRVLRVLRESEGAVQAGTPLLEIGEPSALEIVVDVLTADAIDIAPGARVFVEQWGGEQALNAHVDTVEPSAFTRISSLGVEEQRVNVLIDIDDPYATWRRLGDGYRVEARIVTWEADDVLKVDSSAVFRSGGGWALFRVVDRRARLTPVEVGRRTNREVQIVAGVEEGEAIVLYPGDTIADGVRIEPRVSSPTNTQLATVRGSGPDS